MKKETARQKKIAELMHLFLYTNRLHRSRMEDKIASLGIHGSQHHTLAIIAANKSLCQRDIAQQLDISSAAVAVTLTKLENAGLITKTQSFDDARMNHVTITDKGSALLKASRRLLDELDEDFFNGITDEEIEAMSATLKKVSENAAPKKAD